MNDATERGVKLQADYEAIFTENEEQRKSLLQIVEKHCQKFLDFRKSTLSSKQWLCFHKIILPERTDIIVAT